MLTMYRFGRCVAFCIIRRNFSSPVAPFASRVAQDDGKLESEQTSKLRAPKHNPDGSSGGFVKNPIIAAAFASLTDERLTENPKINTLNHFDEKIIKANTVEDLLKICDQTKVSRKQALKVVSILAEWSSIRKVKLADFDGDPRFIQLCGMLGRANNRKGSSTSTLPIANPLQVDDLQTVLGVTANDEAAKLIAGLSLPQMIKVMTSLSQKKKRSTPLLRSLAFNISSNSNRLNLKECGDLLYAMAVLNFRDPVLTARICADVDQELQSNADKPAPVGSILTSLSLLRYRDTAVLDNISDWIIKNQEICQPAHVSALLLSLATLNYEPVNMETIKAKLISGLTENDFIKSNDWLNTVWSLAVLNCVTSHHLASVLHANFISNLERERKSELTPAIKMKLLNLNAFAQILLNDEHVPKLNTMDPKMFVPIDASRDKRVLIAGMLDALKSLVPSESHVRVNKRTTMGFAIDAECLLDSKCVPLPVEAENGNGYRIAIQVHDYHDMCQGPNPAINGVNALASRLLTKMGYSVLSIPYNEFNTSDKLLKRVGYLQKKFKDIVTGQT